MNIFEIVILFLAFVLILDGIAKVSNDE